MMAIDPLTKIVLSSAVLFLNRKVGVLNVHWRLDRSEVRFGFLLRREASSDGIVEPLLGLLLSEDARDRVTSLVITLVSVHHRVHTWFQLVEDILARAAKL